MDTALNISRFIIAKSWKRNKPVTNLRLQKLLYFLQALSLVRTGRPMFEDKIVAWGFGPVVPTVYMEYMVFGSTLIHDRAADDARVTRYTEKLIDELLVATDAYSTPTLVDICLSQKPCQDAYRITKLIEQQHFSRTWNPYLDSGEITVESIKDYFCDITEKNTKN